MPKDLDDFASPDVGDLGDAFCYCLVPRIGGRCQRQKLSLLLIGKVLAHRGETNAGGALACVSSKHAQPRRLCHMMFLSYKPCGMRLKNKPGHCRAIFCRLLLRRICANRGNARKNWDTRLVNDFEPYINLVEIFKIRS